MRGIGKKLRKEIKRYIAMVLVVTMLPLSSFPAKAVQVEEIPVEQPAEEVTEEPSAQQEKSVSGDSLQPEPEKEQPKESEQSGETDMANAYLDPAIREQSIGDKTVSGNWILEEDTVVDELVFTGEKLDLNGYTLTVCEDLILEKGVLYSSYGDLIVWGDFRVQSQTWDEETENYNYGLSEAFLSISYSTSDPTYLLVAGDMYVDSVNAGSYTLNGILELKGNLYQRENESAKTSEGYVYARDGLNFDYSSELILSGAQKQILQWSGANTSNQIGNLTIANTSEDGVIFEREPLVYTSVHMTRENKTTGILRIYDSVEFSEQYFRGDLKVCDYQTATIETNLELDGNLYLQGTIALRGDITIHGDVIVMDTKETTSSVSSMYAYDINFTVDGDINATGTQKDWTFYLNNYSGVEKEFYVGGDFIGENVNFNAGNMTVKFCGNVSLSQETGAANKVYFYVSSSRVILCGQQRQDFDLGGDTGRFQFGTLESQNESEEGVHFSDLTYIENMVLNENKVYFDEKLAIAGRTLEEDLIFEEDSVFVNGTWDLNGHRLICKGDLRVYEGTICVNGGKLSVSGNCLVDYHGMLDMTNAQDVVCVEQDMTFMSRYTTEGHLTNGLLLVHGNFSSLVEKGYDKVFRTTEQHVTRIVRKNYNDETVQKIALENTQEEPYFATLEIGTNADKYYEYDGEPADTAQTLSNYYFDEERPSSVGDIYAKEATYTSVTIGFEPAKDPDGIAFYEVYRDGKKIDTISANSTSYCDKYLKENTEYCYEIFAQDMTGCTAMTSPKYYVSTAKDIIPPKKVEGVRVYRRTGSRVDLQWNVSYDNHKMGSYILYRNGQIAAEGIEKSYYTDTNLEPDKSYEYYVVAVDAAGNHAEKSEAVETMTALPDIVSVYPENGASIGTSQFHGAITLVNDTLAGIRNVSLSYYDAENDQWIRVYEGKVKPSSTGVTNIKKEVTADISALSKEEDVLFQWCAKDTDGNTVEKEVSYHVDKTAPEPVTDLEAFQENAKITLTWTGSVDEDCTKYHIYRKTVSENTLTDPYEYIATQNATEENIYCYIDRDVSQQYEYSYMVKAADEFDNESDSEEVKVYVEIDLIAPTKPQEVYVQRRTGSSITLAWSGATDNVGVEGYHIYRDGKLIARQMKGWSYKDTGSDLENGLEPYVVYQYSVEAFDSAGNVSERSVEADGAVAMPEIEKILPKDQTTIGAEFVNLAVQFKDSGNSIENLVFFEWYDEQRQEWILLNQSGAEQFYYDNNTLYASYKLQLSRVEVDTTKAVDFKITVRDADGNTAEEIVTYTMDKTAAVAPANITATESDGTVIVKWDPSDSADAEGYYLYRAQDGEEFRLQAHITGRMSGWYQDKEVETGKTYSYCLSAYDVFEQEGEKSGEIEITVTSVDESEPQIKAMEPSAGRVNKTVDIWVEGVDNRAVVATDFFIRADEESEWTKLTTVSANDSQANYMWDTTKVKDGNYYIKAEVRDAAGNINKNLYQRRYEVDNTGISKIEMDKCQMLASVIRLKWKDVTEDDFGYFVVEQKVEHVSDNEISYEWERIKKIEDSLGYDVKNLTPDREYTFRVVGYDNLENRGECSEEITLMTLADVNAPVIKRIDPVSTYYGDSIKLKITAEDNVGLGKAVFSYSEDGEEFIVLSEEISEGKAREEFSYSWDTSELPEGEVIVRFEVYDAAGIHNRLLQDEQQIDNLYTIDHTPPDKVKNVWATDTDGCVGLAWQLGKEADIEKYCIYRSSEIDGEYTRIAKKSVKSYYDNNVEYGGTYYYKVSCIDIAGNESELSNPLKVEVMPDDILPVVTGISPADTSVLGKETEFSILAYDNAKIAQVRLEYRLKSDGGAWTEIGVKETDRREAYVKFAWTATGIQEGELYEIRALALDKAGNVSVPCVKEYSFDLTPPEVPELSADVGSYRIHLQFGCQQEGAEYQIWRKMLGESDYKCIMTTTSESYEDVTVMVNSIYYYKVRVYDEYGNYSESEAVYSHADNVDTIAPVAQLPEVVMAVDGLSTAFDGTMSTDNKRIVRYEWNFGDGTKATGAKPQHSYNEAGTYTITLTAYDMVGNSSTTYSTVNVLDKTSHGQTNIYIKGSDGLPIGGAEVYVNIDGTEETTIRCKTDSNGMAAIIAEPGIYEIAAFAEGYSPVQDFVAVLLGEPCEQEMILPTGDFVTGDIQVERMELEDLIAADVDLSDPKNYHTYKFRVTLGFVECPIPVVHVGNSQGSAKRSFKNYGFKGYPFKNGGSNLEVICKENEEEEPQPVALIYMTVVKSVSWLKDMYNVQLNISNHAQSGFVLSDSSATIQLPDGLSLAKTTSGQTTTEQMGDIDGQEMSSVSWIVRGDKTGSYPIKATFNANIMPFDIPISREYESQEAVEVYAGKGLSIAVMPEAAAFYGQEYYIKFKVQNNSDRTLYGIGLKYGGGSSEADGSEQEGGETTLTLADPETCEINEETVEGNVTFSIPDGSNEDMTAVVHDGDSLKIGMLRPGEAVNSKYVGTLDVSDEEHYLKLVTYFTEVLKGENLGVSVSVSPIASHISMPVKYVTDGERDTYGDPVDVTTGAFLQEFSAFMGQDTSLIDFTYDSTRTVSCNDVGYGWSHSYDQRVFKRDGQLYVAYGNGVEIPFENEIDKMNATRGVLIKNSELENTVIVTDKTKCEAKGNVNYAAKRSKSFAMKGDSTLELRTKGEPIYKLTDAEGTQWIFDGFGDLIKRVTKAGITFTYVKADNKLVITNELSQEKMTITYADGKMVEICDSADRKIFLAYDERGDLVTYTDEEGNATQLFYDENHHLCKGVGPTGIVLFENTYDAKGRVTSQVEAGSSEKSLLAYEELENSSLKTTITKRDGSQLVYVSDRNGNITYEKDELGNVTSYEYNEPGALVKETSPKGNITSYVYDEEGKLLQMTDPIGNTLKYSYDLKGNPMTITGADTSQGIYVYDENDRLRTIYGVLGEEQSYEYDDLGQLVKETAEGLGSITYQYENGRKVSETDRRGNTTKYSYDVYGNLESTTDAKGNQSTCKYDPMGRVIEITDAAGLTTDYQYDRLGRLVRESVGGRKTFYEYDDAGRVISVTDPSGAQTKYQYDTEGNMTVITHPDGNQTKNTYDAAGRLIETILPDKSTKQYEYDADGYLTAETIAGQKTTYTYYGNGKKKSAIYPDGREETYTYDTNGYLSTVTDAEGNKTKYTYNAAGNLLSVTDALGNVQSYEYDIHGNLTKQTDANKNTEAFSYDANGNCITKTNAEGTKFYMTYDSLDRLISVSVNSAGQVLTNTYSYDAAGNVSAITNAEGNTQSVEYDAYGNVTRIIDEDGNVIQKLSYDALDRVKESTTANGNKTEYVYDGNGNLAQVIADNNAIYSYAYDAMGRLTASEDPEKGVSKTSYTASGNVASVTDPMGGVTSYTYDPHDRVIEVISAIGSMQQYTYNAQGLLEESENARGQKTQYTYDALGRIVSQTDELGTISYTYDANGNVLKVEEEQGLTTKAITRTFDCMNRVTSVTDYHGNTITYGYDELGNRISITYPGGEIVRYTYDKCGRMLSATDAKGNVTRFVYDRTGKLIKQTRPDGSVESRTYDTDGQLIRQEDRAADGSVLHTLTYTYDSAGNITEKTGVDIPAQTENARMTYDADNRLITYNGEKVTYDADGNMLCGPLDGQMADFTYDCRNRLIKVETEDGQTTEYEYDAENIRLTGTVGDSRSTFVTDREAAYSQVLVEIIDEKNLFGIFAEKEIKTYTYGNGLLSEYRESEDKALYYHFDNIGSTLAVTEESGNIRHVFTYGTYGELLTCDEDADIRFLYNGEYGIQTDKNSLYYMRARYYNTDIKRFINRDIIDGSIADSQSLNKYSYVQGNPVSLIDPFGLCPEGAFDGFDGHDLLDLLGMFFDGADLINALWYLSEGDLKNAALSAMALIPVLGAVGVGGYKLAKNGIKVGKNLADAGVFANKFAKYANKIKDAFQKFGSKFGKYADDIKNAARKAARSGGKADTAKDTARAAAKNAAKKAEDAAGAAKAGGKGGADVSKPYATSRPSYGKGQVEQVWENAKDPVTGKVYDPSGVEITWNPTKPRNGQWDMGHKPGEKYSEMHQLYMDGVISKEEFLDWYRNPDNYRPELPSTNRSHKYE